MKFEVRLKRDTHLHSKEHVLADDLSRAMGELKRFASYLGIARLYYEEDLRSLMRRVIEKEDLPFESRGKYFFAALKGLKKKPAVMFRRYKGKRNAKRVPKKKGKNLAVTAKNGKTARTTRDK